MCLFCIKILSLDGRYILFTLFIKNSDRITNWFYLLFIKPFVVLLITVLLRILIDRPRPIQKYDLKPIDDKKRIGHSFPSIHTSLAISIALTVIARGPNMGLLLSALAITITCTRLLTGVHYLTDILASILIALAIYMI